MLDRSTFMDISLKPLAVFLLSQNRPIAAAGNRSVAGAVNTAKLPKL
jgi:hypothetical protein